MKILFVHNNFPAQFHRVSIALAEDSKNEVAFLSRFKREDMVSPKVHHFQIKPPPKDKVIHYTEEHLLYAQAFVDLRNAGYYPDIIHGHAAFGTIAYARDIFPKAKVTGYFEWMYSKETEKYINPTDYETNIKRAVRHRFINMLTLSALNDVSAGISPMQWQKKQHPLVYSDKIEVLHESIDTDFFSPNSDDQIELFKHSEQSEFTKFLSQLRNTEIITYTSRALESIRGFNTFYESLPAILSERPNAHVIIIGKSSPAYGDRPEENKDWIDYMKEKVPLKPKEQARVHHAPFLSYMDYRALLQSSSVHVYLTAPFVLSFSMLEAMSCGCLLVASDTPPVREVAMNGYNALMTPFPDSKALAERIIYALKNKKELTLLKENARKTVLENYSLSTLLPKQVNFFNKIHSHGASYA